MRWDTYCPSKTYSNFQIQAKLLENLRRDLEDIRSKNSELYR